LFTLLPKPDTALSHHYYYVTQRPWPSLVFILPMLLFFELGTYLRQDVTGVATTQLVAEYLIHWLVTQFGTSSVYVPGLLAVVILLAWHVAGRHPWRFDPFVLPGMLGESLVWSAPLFVFNKVMHVATLTAATTQEARADWLDRVILSFGAGIYEELVFRLICITLLVILLIDVCKLPRATAGVFIALASATLFAAHHHPPLGNAPYNTIDFMFRTAAGLYLAGLFIFRGFGIAAGCHALYNVIAVTLKAIG
jgi:hypothetical protein